MIIIIIIIMILAALQSPWKTIVSLNALLLMVMMIYG